MKSNSVIQEWLTNLSWKKQTTVLGAIRSPDTLTTLNLKKLTTWIRCHALENADPMTGFMRSELQSLPLFEQMDREFERLPLHAAHHILLAFQIIGTEHPKKEIRENAWKFYSDAVYAQHLNQETREQYESRYEDKSERILSYS